MSNVITSTTQLQHVQNSNSNSNSKLTQYSLQTWIIIIGSIGLCFCILVGVFVLFGCLTVAKHKRKKDTEITEVQMVEDEVNKVRECQIKTARVQPVHHKPDMILVNNVKMYVNNSTDDLEAFYKENEEHMYCSRTAESSIGGTEDGQNDQCQENGNGQAYIFANQSGLDIRKSV